MKVPPGRTIHHPLQTPHYPTAPARPAPIQVVRPVLPTYFLPLPVPQGQPVIYGGVERDRQVFAQTAVTYGMAGHYRPVKPLSFHPVDPYAVITRLPSGRIAMSPPPGFLPLTQREVARSNKRMRPYAPPSFQLIGEQTPAQAANAVHLRYGVKPSRRFNPEPQVVFLDERGRVPSGSAQIHHLK